MLRLLFRSSRSAVVAVCFLLTACDQNFDKVRKGRIDVPRYDLSLELYSERQWEASAGVDAVVSIGGDVIGVIPAFAFFNPAEESIREIDLSFHVSESSPGEVYGLIEGYPVFFVDTDKKSIYPSQTYERDTLGETALKKAKAMIPLNPTESRWIQ